MKRKAKQVTIIFMAFASGMFLQSRLFAKISDAPLKSVPVIDEGVDRHEMTGRASWYSRRSPGINKRTANNEIFDDSQLTCAMWGVPFHQKIRVTNLANGKSIVVRVNDRGPHRRYVRQGRVVDLSRKAFSQIASLKSGLIDVHLELL